jgi:pantoate--beta-alanine ligase
MSSRNIHLTPEELEASPVIYNSLLAAAEMIRESSVHETAAMVKDNIESGGLFKVQYFEMVDSDTLQPVSSWDPYHAQRACIAVITSKTRLIDNIAL